MGFVGKEKAAPETAREIGLESAEALAVDPLEAFRALGEARQVGGIARRSHDEAAFLDGARKVPQPPGNRRRPQTRHDFLGCRTLAPGGQHAARHPRAGPLAQGRCAFDDIDGKAARAQFHGARKTCDAGPNN